MTQDWFVSNKEMVDAFSNFCEGCTLSEYKEHNTFREYRLIIRDDDGYVKECIGCFITANDLSIVVPYDAEIAQKIQGILDDLHCRNITCRFLDNIVINSNWRTNR